MVQRLGAGKGAEGGFSGKQTTRDPQLAEQGSGTCAKSPLPAGAHALVSLV